MSSHPGEVGLLKAEAALNEGDLLAARTFYQEAIEAFGEDELQSALARVELAMVSIELDQLDEAVDALSRALELDPLFPDSYVSLARIASIAQRPEQAREILNAGLQLMPGQAQLLAELTNASVIAGDLDGGAEVAETLASQAPHDPTAQNNFALHLLANRQFKDVIELCTGLHGRGVRSASLSCTLANAYEAIGDMESAMAVYAEAARHETSDWQAPNNLGLLLLQMGESRVVPEAIELFKEANRREPSQIEPLLNLALAYARTEKRAKALDLARYVASYDLRPDHPVKEQATRLVQALSTPDGAGSRP